MSMIINTVLITVTELRRVISLAMSTVLSYKYTNKVISTELTGLCTVVII